jgi:glycosyltransferase involved in cell wall biosynthesis
MRLAHFIQRYPPALGGSEAYFARLSRYCAAQGDEVKVFTTTALSLEAFWSRTEPCLQPGTETDAGVTIHRYPLWRMPGRRWLLKALSFFSHRLWQCLTLPCNPIAPGMWSAATSATMTFDAVHVSAFPYAYPIACGWRLARRLKAPFFITPFLHLGNPADPNDPTRRGYTSKALRWLLAEADGIFVQTPSERDAIIGLGIPADNVILQGLGVEPSECTGGNRADARRCWNLPRDAFVVGHLANQSWEKGTNDLITALEPFWAQGRPIHLLLAGPQMPNFARFWDAFEKRCPTHAHCWIRRLGPITDAEKRDFFAAIDLFALPSRSDSFGLVLLEAWANSIANVAYCAGGIADVIRHEQDGLLTPCGDIPGLSDSIRRLHDDRDLRLTLGQAGLARLPVDYRWSEKLSLVRQEIAKRAQKKTRTEEASRTLPTLRAALRSE